MIRNHESKEKTEESKDSSETPQKEEEKRRSPTPPPARISPEPSCAICLEQLRNKSFTDSCFHMFCFTCLVEWSKVKPECPLCKKSFKSIVHNVRSFKDYDQYYISKSRISDDLWQCVTERFRYSTTLTPDRIIERSQIEYSGRIASEIASHRMRYAPHSVHSTPMYQQTTTIRRIPNAFRRRIYEENMWVVPQISNRVRCISPAFFRRNIACTHRLLPWLNRELMVVMPNNEIQISFVIELIVALIVKYEITSQEFHTLLEPYIGSHTSHFIHEFYNFAVSAYESMETYDLHANYSGAYGYPHVEAVSSPDSDVIALPPEESGPQKSSSSHSPRKKKQHHSKKKHLNKEFKKLKKIILKRNTESNCWESVSSPAIPYFSADEDMPGPSTSRGISSSYNPFGLTNPDWEWLYALAELEEKDEECQIVDVLKPKAERTPEVVNLTSDDERLIVEDILDDSDFDDAAIKSKNSPSKVSSKDHPLSPSDDDDDEIIFVKESKPSLESTHPILNDMLDKPIDYSLKITESKSDIEFKNVEPCSSSSKDNSELDASKIQKNCILQSAVRTLNNDDTGSSSWSPLVRPKKRKAPVLDDVSTESCSEGGQVTELDTRMKKLKLKSVIAHYLIDGSDEHESSRRSLLHKKHKDKKKKKKKHKHKRRIFSSDSDC